MKRLSLILAGTLIILADAFVLVSVGSNRSATTQEIELTERELDLQRAGEDSILYTKPVFKNRPDGSQQFSHAIGIKMAIKTIVLSMPTP